MRQMLGNWVIDIQAKLNNFLLCCLPLCAALVFLCAATALAGNEAQILQDGAGHRLQVEQVFWNEGTPDLGPGEGANRVSAVQAGRSNLGRLNQQGAGNQVEIFQGGDLNHLEVLQYGLGNRVDLEQAGHNNRAVVHQDGDFHSAGISQRGDENTITLNQFGQGRHFTITQQGQGFDLSVTQEGF